MEKRLQIDFSDKAYKELEALQERLDATSKSEVIRDALGLLRWLAEEVVDKNHRILVEKPEEGGATREVVFHFLERSRSHDKKKNHAATLAN
jgi:Arc/MetJ-type ribon-helix-helix transcriptional regulator